MARVAVKRGAPYTFRLAKATAQISLIRAFPLLIARTIHLFGFPALVVRTPQLNLACNVEVDVADGQHLDVLYRDDGAQPPASLDQLCAGAQRVADVSVSALTRQAQQATRAATSTEPTN